MDKLAYLQQEPEEDKVITFDNGVKILPFAVIEQYLDELCDYNWSTRNFIHSYSIINNEPSISASIELEITYTVVNSWDEKNVNFISEIKFDRKRTLVGAVTYPLEFFKTISGSDTDSLGNQHYAASAKSLCIVNAAKSIGKRFGRDLNSILLENKSTDLPHHEEKAIDYKYNDEYEIFKDELLSCLNPEAALAILINSKFATDQHLNLIVNNWLYKVCHR